MKFKLVENINGGHDDVSSNDILNEATYALTDKRKISKRDLITTVLGWRMVELFKDESKIHSLTPGFSIMSNVRGNGNKDDLLSHFLNRHHTEGSHNKESDIYLSTQLHTKLHNIIRNLFIKDVDSDSEIGKQLDEIYNKFEKTYNIKLTSYEYFGERLRAYETALKEVALLAHKFLSNDDYIKDLYNRAQQQLK